MNRFKFYQGVKGTVLNFTLGKMNCFKFYPGVKCTVCIEHACLSDRFISVPLFTQGKNFVAQGKNRRFNNVQRTCFFGSLLAMQLTDHGITNCPLQKKLSYSRKPSVDFSSCINDQSKNRSLLDNQLLTRLSTKDPPSTTHSPR